MNTEHILQEILGHPSFIYLKTITESATGWHDHEDVYSHSLATLDRARDALHGSFITDQKTKELFITWIKSEVAGVLTQDVLLITALIHDCGKVLSYKENQTVYSINEIVKEDQTSAFEHEYWGAKLVVPQILSSIEMPEEAKQLIVELVSLHGIFNGFFFSRLDLSAEQLVHQIKAYGHGWYKELLFNSYADCQKAAAFTEPKKRIEMVLNNPKFYTQRTYFAK